MWLCKCRAAEAQGALRGNEEHRRRHLSHRRRGGRRSRRGRHAGHWRPQVLVEGQRLRVRHAQLAHSHRRHPVAEISLLRADMQNISRKLKLTIAYSVVEHRSATGIHVFTASKIARDSKSGPLILFRCNSSNYFDNAASTITRLWL